MCNIDTRSIAYMITNGKSETLKYDFAARKERRKGKPMNLNVCRENLSLLKDIFDKHTIKFFLIWGSCLGAVRNGNFISYDSDTDIGVYMKDRDKIIAVVPEFKKVGFEPIRTSVPDDALTLMRNDEYIDIGFFQKRYDEHQKSYWGYQNHRVYGEHLDHLDTIDFLGEEYNVPQNVDKYLTRVYGITWKIPIKEIPNTPCLSTFRLICRRILRKILRLQ